MGTLRMMLVMVALVVCAAFGGQVARASQGLPDLTAMQRTFTPDPGSPAGEQVVTLMNIGLDNAGAFEIKLIDVQRNRTLKTMKYNYLNRSTEASFHYRKRCDSTEMLVVDFRDQVVESDETNNSIMIMPTCDPIQ